MRHNKLFQNSCFYMNVRTDEWSRQTISIIIFSYAAVGSLGTLVTFLWQNTNIFISQNCKVETRQPQFLWKSANLTLCITTILKPMHFWSIYRTIFLFFCIYNLIFLITSIMIYRIFAIISRIWIEASLE